jgi:tetratricopeptide (TPR) repeat protein
MKRLLTGIMLSGMALFAQPPAPVAPVAPVSPPTPVAAPHPMVMARGMAGRDSESGAYRRGSRALDERRYDDAVKAFDAVIESKQSRTDGALYWKSYALNKLGRRNEALAALDQLEKEYGSSAWLNDAKALRLEVQQSSGQPVSPESQPDEDLKLLAINGLMHSDPDRAMPLLDKVLSDPKTAPKVKERALFVLAQSRNPKSRESLMNIAKGGGNPDLQVKAIEYLGMFGGRDEVGQLYSQSASPQVKEAVINSLMLSKNVDKLADIARTEKDPRLRTSAIERIGMIHSERTGDLLVSLYSGDATTKAAVINGLMMQNNGKQMVELARKEQDPKLKKQLVERLSMMRNKEATDYMMELLK